MIWRLFTKYLLLSAFFAGVAGVLYAHNVGIIKPTTFDYNKSIEILVIVVLGGMGSIRGSIIAAVVLTILPENVIRAYDHRILNIHPSLIPSFCGDGFYGLHVHEAALKRGVKVTGATVHFVNEITDGGDIIAQKAVEVLPGDTPEILQRRVMEQAEWILLPQALEQVAGEIAKKREEKQ